MKENFNKIQSLSFLLFLTVYSFCGYSQDSAFVKWQLAVGGSKDDRAASIDNTFDGGFIFAGYTLSTDGDVSGFHGGYGGDVWIVKYDSTHQIEWQKVLGGSNWDQATSVQQTHDSGYIIGAQTSSIDGDITSYHGSTDWWIIRLDRFGNIVWQKTYGGSRVDELNSIKETPTGDFVAVGDTYSNDGNVTGFHTPLGTIDAWIMKINSNGAILWQRAYGGTSTDSFSDVIVANDGNYIVAGYTTSTNGDIISSKGGADAWLLKFNLLGAVSWKRNIGGTGGEVAYSLTEDEIGNIYVAGSSNSIEAFLGENKGGSDYWVFRTDKDGILQASAMFGGTRSDIAKCIINDGSGFIVGGSSYSDDLDVPYWYGSDDFWVLRLDANLKFQWTKILGGTNSDEFFKIIKFKNNEFIACGATTSNNRDVSGLHSSYFTDSWIVNLGTPAPPIVWTGAANENWLNPFNWVNNLVPDANSYVLIPAGTPHNPVIYAGNPVSVKRITLESGAIMKVESNAVFNVLH